MDLVAVYDLMMALPKDRPVFHSEADFQHALAWELHKRHPTAPIRLEQHVHEGLHLDLSIKIEGATIAFELKYISRDLRVSLDGELFALRRHGAHPPRRYDVLRDVVRLETLVAEGLAAKGYAIVLTNDPAYWTAGRDAEGVGDAFRIHEGRRILGDLRWGTKAAPGTTRGREPVLQVVNEHVTAWRDYSTVKAANGTFRFLIFEVARHQG